MRPWLLVVALAWLFLGGCRLADTPPDLLDVLDVAPRVVDVGDQFEVIGAGFPEGRVGTVTFRGQAHRPGANPEPLFLTVRAASVSRNRITIEVTEDLQGRLCGAGREARHTTFRGSLLVAFSPQQAGAPPITGTLGDVVLDVTSAPLEADARAKLLEEGKRASQFFGLALDADKNGPLSVAGLVPAGRAERAGLLEGDRLLQFNGVVVRDVGDLTPGAGQRLVSVSVQRGRSKDPVLRVIDADGFAPTAPQELALAGTLIAFVVAVMLLFVAPVARVMTWAERRVALRLRDTTSAKSRGPQTWLDWVGHAARSVAMERVIPASGGQALLRVVPYLQFLAVSAGFTLVAFGLPVVAEDLDLPLALLVSTTALVTIGLMLNGWRGARGWSLFAGLKSALLLLLFQLPAISVFSVVVLTTGSSRAADLVATQGPLPWQWLVFANPLLLVGLAVLLAAALPEASRSPLDLPEADASRSAVERRANPASRCLMFFAEWGHVFVLSGLVAVLLLGGWNVPGVDPRQQEQSLRWQILGAVLLQVKCWGTVLFVRAARWVLPRLAFEQMTGLFWRWLVPLTLMVVGLTLGWSWGDADEFMRSLQNRASIVLFAVTLFIAAYLGVRVLVNLRSRSAQVNVNPWL